MGNLKKFCQKKHKLISAHRKQICAISPIFVVGMTLLSLRTGSVGSGCIRAVLFFAAASLL